MFCDILTGREPLDQSPVQLPVGSIIDIGDISVRLVEKGAPDQPLQAVIFSTGVFDIHQHSESILEENFFRLQVVALGNKKHLTWQPRAFL